MNQPLISILIPTYNVERFVEEAVRSILMQTYTNLEIIIVDDCSTDNTYSILKLLAEEDDRIRLFRNKENSKIVYSLNFALRYAKGEFIARMDGDDVSLPERIEKLYQFLLNNPRYDLVGSNVIVIDEEGIEIHKQNCLTNDNNIKHASKFASPILHIWLSKKIVYEKVGEYRIPTVEDYDFILRAIDNGFGVINIPDFLYSVRVRKGNTATTAGLIQRKSFAYAWNLHKERIKEKSLGDSYSIDNLINSISSNKLERYMFSISCKFHFNYMKLKNKNISFAMINLFLSIVFSPVHQFKHIYNRIQYKKLFLEV